MILNDVIRPYWQARDLHFLVELRGFEPLHALLHRRRWVQIASQLWVILWGLRFREGDDDGAGRHGRSRTGFAG